LDERAGDLRNRGVRDVFFLVCDGLKGLPEVVANVWPETIVQTCLIHYADLTVMPIWSRDRFAGRGLLLPRLA
jgi:putative transposase